MRLSEVKTLVWGFFPVGGGARIWPQPVYPHIPKPPRKQGQGWLVFVESDSSIFENIVPQAIPLYPITHNQAQTGNSVR